MLLRYMISSSVNGLKAILRMILGANSKDYYYFKTVIGNRLYDYLCSERF